MKTKLSEVKLLVAFIFLVAAIAIFFNVKFFSTPIQVSELALVLSAVALTLIFFAIRLFRSAIKKA